MKKNIKFTTDDIIMLQTALSCMYYSKECTDEYRELLLDTRIEYPTTQLDVASNFILNCKTGDKPCKDVQMKNTQLKQDANIIDMLEFTYSNMASNYNEFIGRLKGSIDASRDYKLILAYDKPEYAFNDYISNDLLVLKEPINNYPYAYWNGRTYILYDNKSIHTLYSKFIDYINSEYITFTGDEYDKCKSKSDRWLSRNSRISAIEWVTIREERQYDNTIYDSSKILTKDGSLIDFANMEIRKCTRADKMLKAVNFELKDIEEATRFMTDNIAKTYKPILGNKLYFLFDFLACKLKGMKFQKALFMYGNACTGKSLFKNISLDILGDMATTLNKNYVTHNHKDNADTSRDDYLSSLHNKSLGLLSEYDNGDIMNGARFKTLLSGTKETARKSYGTLQDVDLSRLDLLADTNDIPTFTNLDNAIQRRLLYINFTGRIEEPNPDFYRDIIKPNLDYIFTYLVYRALMLDKLDIPESIKADTDRAINNISPINEFINNRIEYIPGAKAKVTDIVKALYDAYDDDELKAYKFTDIDDTKISNGKILMRLFRDNLKLGNIELKRIRSRNEGSIYYICNIALKEIVNNEFSNADIKEKIEQYNLNDYMN